MQLPNLPWYGDWLEIGSAVFAVLTFIIAIAISLRQDSSNKRFIQSQVNEKIAVLYSYADAFYEVFQKNSLEENKKSGLRYSIAPHLVERMSTDLQAIYELADDVPKKKREPLFKVMAVLISEMEKAGYGEDAKSLNSTFHSVLD